jgi:hypothetical protein
MNIKKNGKVINLTESDLRRIVKKVISEQEIAPGGGGVNVGVGYKFDNGLTINIAPEGEIDGKVWLQVHDDGSGEEFSCDLHERGLYKTENGRYIFTKEESKSLYNKFCKK